MVQLHTLVPNKPQQHKKENVDDATEILDYQKSDANFLNLQPAKVTQPNPQPQGYHKRSNLSL